MPAADHAPSYYAATAIGLWDYPALEGGAICDVCVIGGGFTGLSAALHLAERGYDVVLLEAERIGWGASGRNGGQVNTGQRKGQRELEERLGLETARQLWALAEEAKATVKQRIEAHNIPCDFKSGHISAAHKPGDVGELEAEAALLHSRYDYSHISTLSKAEVAEKVGSTRYHGGILDGDAWHLHPLNYALGLARAAAAAGARLHEASRVTDYRLAEPARVMTAKGEVRARYVVLACNGYLGDLEPRVAGRIMPINNFILATEPLSEAREGGILKDDCAVSDTKFVVDYYRLSADKRLLFGGGETYSMRFPRDLRGFVRTYMLRVYPQLDQARIDYAWGGTLAITLSRLPCFGRLAPNGFYALGYSGQGVALTSLAGKLIAEAVAGTAERFDVFARLPQRRFPGGTLLRWPGLVAAMLYYSLRDKL